MLGLPITAGFLGKLYIFTAALNSNLYWLAVLMAINSTIGAYYYIRVIVVMYMHEYKGPVPADAPARLSPTAAMVVTVTVIATIYLGLAPNHILSCDVAEPSNGSLNPLRAASPVLSESGNLPFRPLVFL